MRRQLEIKFSVIYYNSKGLPTHKAPTNLISRFSQLYHLQIIKTRCNYNSVADQVLTVQVMKLKIKTSCFRQGRDDSSQKYKIVNLRQTLREVLRNRTAILQHKVLLRFLIKEHFRSMVARNLVSINSTTQFSSWKRRCLVRLGENKR